MTPRPFGPAGIQPAAPDRTTGGAAPTDRLAVASTFCGMTAFIPIISQLAAVLLGLVALHRIRRARRAGVPARGVGWALAGIAAGLIVLAGWIGAAMLLVGAGTVLQGVSDQIGLPPG